MRRAPRQGSAVIAWTRGLGRLRLCAASAHLNAAARPDKALLTFNAGADCSLVTDPVPGGLASVNSLPTAAFNFVARDGDVLLDVHRRSEHQGVDRRH